jgi:stage V sporulation protein D (sporulation-specific penicillin-binding protein)
LGLSGLEKYYDNLLAGENGEISYSTDIVGVERENGTIIYSKAADGDEIRLTIDVDIQLAAERAMKEVYASSGAKSVSCIVMNPNNFDILAMVNYPSYNLNDVPRDDTETLNTLSRNSLVCDIYEPGSTFKVITAAANIEEYIQGNSKAFSNTYVFNSSRTRIVDGTTIKCWSDHTNGKHSNQTLSAALNNSCNPCFTDIALALGEETFYSYLRSFGFGNVTGIDFNGEALGMLVPESLVRDCDLARIGFGQTIAVSGIQLASAVSAAINGGNYYTPHLLKSVVTNGKAKDVDYEVKSHPISEQASNILREMLEGVVKEGSGKHAYIDGYRVGGKTGTAQKYENGHIAVGKYVSSFVGFFPANSPEYLALIIVDEPQGTYYGSAVAAPVAKSIFEDIIKIKNIQPVE